MKCAPRTGPADVLSKKPATAAPQMTRPYMWHLPSCPPSLPFPHMWDPCAEAPPPPSLLTHVMAMYSLLSSPSPSSLRALGPDEEAGVNDLGVGAGVRGCSVVSQHGRSGERICRIYLCSGGGCGEGGAR